MFKMFAASFFVPLLIVYGAYVLWPASHCVRIEHAAYPAYVLGQVIRMGLEPFVRNEDRIASLRRYPGQLQTVMTNMLSKVFYDRASHEVLCATDPVEVFRRAGRLNERGLVAFQGERLAVADSVSVGGGSSQVQHTSVQRMTPHHEYAEAKPVPNVKSTESETLDWLKRAWLWIAGSLLFVAILFDSSRKAILELVLKAKFLKILLPPCRKLYAAHKQVLEHILPRAVIRPMVGKKRTDLTE